ncbi:hypothetical protein OGAPHI_000397 [Ogataea philodendri]|uniref:Serine/threonine-protein kinase MEC1 n=2 Tax=Saccharomycotina TaxID=147537 RepID=A0A9P8PH37_9ASCO|nr:uncharacterized protein OGAPHI_000397 [Ogataea philodendri]KAH3671692.1 hypothetical protein OGAPHI_000397 [Ogataea philodendri]
MSDQTRQLSTVLDTLLRQQSEGETQDSNSLNALLSSVLPAYSKRSLTQEEQDVVLKIFQAVHLLTSRSPPLLFDNNRYKSVIRSYKNFYDARYHGSLLATMASKSLKQIISDQFRGRLASSIQLTALRTELVDILVENLDYVLESITNSTSSKPIDLDSISTTNDYKFSKLSISTRILELLLDPSLEDALLLHSQNPLSIDTFIGRLWFCMENVVVNLKFNNESLGETSDILSQTSVDMIVNKFDILYAVLLNSSVKFVCNDHFHQHTRLDTVLSKCKELLGWPLLAKFSVLQTTLAESLMKLFILCKEQDNLCYLWNKLGISSDKLAEENLPTTLSPDLSIVFHLFLVLNYKLQDTHKNQEAPLLSKNHVKSLEIAFRYFSTEKLDNIRNDLLLCALEDEMEPDVDVLLPLTNSKAMVSLLDPTDRISKAKSVLHITHNSGPQVVDLTSSLYSQNSVSDTNIRSWIEQLRQLIRTGEFDKLNNTSIGKILIVNAIGNYACLVAGDFDYKAQVCRKCTYSSSESVYIPDVVDPKRPAISSRPEMKLAFEILMDYYISDPASLNNEQLIVSILISLHRILCSYRSPPLRKVAKLWEFLESCFISVVREIRLLTVKIFPLLLFVVEDEQYDSDFDIILRYLSMTKVSKKTAYLFEGIIMSWGELIMISRLEGKLYIMLNHLIQYLGDNDQFRSNLSFHELRIVASTKKMTAWKLVEPFIPLISYELIQKRNSHPNMLRIFCDCIKMDTDVFLNRVMEFTVPLFIQSFTEDHIGFIASQVGKTRTQLVTGYIEKILAILLTADETIDATKIMKIVTVSNPKYKGVNLKTLISESRVMDLVWEILCLYNSDHMKEKIRKAIIYSCMARHIGSFPVRDEDEILNREMDLMILGIAQSFSATIYDHRGSRPYLVKIQAIRAIRCITEISTSFQTCLSQIMTCLQIALESPELQMESLECLHVLVSNLGYSPLSIIVDLLISYLIQKYRSFSKKSKEIAKNILVTIFEKDPKIMKDHPSYVYSLSLISDFDNITNRYDIKNHNILVEFDRRFHADNKWVVLQVLDDFKSFLDSHQLEIHKTYLNDSRLLPLFSSLLAQIMSVSNKFSVTNTEIPRKCAEVLACLGALDLTKVGYYFHRGHKRIILVSNLVNSKETADFSVYFLNNILVKAFVASTDPQKQLFLAYSMQEYLKILDFTPENINDRESSESLIWAKLTNLSQTVLRPLLVSRYMKNTYGYTALTYPCYKNTKKHSFWIREFTEDLLHRSEDVRKLPKTAKAIFATCSIVIKDQDLSIAEFLLPYVTLMMIAYGDEGIRSDIEVEIKAILNEDFESLSNDSVIESLRSCYRTVFSIIDYFREWVSERKRDKKYLQGSFLEERKKVEDFLSLLPSELLAKRTAQCNSYERAIFNLEQSYAHDKMDKDEFFSTIRHMYAEINDTDALQGVLKKFSTESLHDKLLQFQYSEDWRVTQESLAALTELDYKEDNEQKLNSVTSLLRCLDEHCEYDQVLSKLRELESSLPEFEPTKDWVVCGLQASIFSGQLEELKRWVRMSEKYPSITSPGSQLSIYYEFAQGLITLNLNDLETCEKHISNAIKYVGTFLSVSREISPSKISNYMVMLHCLYDFRALSSLPSAKKLQSCLDLLQIRARNSTKDFKINWKIHSLSKSIEKLHPLSEVRDHVGDSMVQGSRFLREAGKYDLATKSITNALFIGTSSELQVNLEFAKLLWAQGDHSQALKILKSLLGASEVRKSPEIQLTYTEWLEQSANGSSDEIIKGYEAAAAVDSISGKPQYFLGRYYNKLLDARAVETPGLKKPERDFYGDLEFNIIKAYIRSAAFSNDFVFEVLPKAVTIWLNYSAKYQNASDLTGYSYETIHSKRRDNYSSILKFVKVAASKNELPIYKWYTVLSQLLSRMVHGDSETEVVILNVITQLAKAYPEVVLYSVYAQVQSTSPERAKRGKQICETLQNNKKTPLSKQVYSAFQLLEALKGVCQADISRQKRTKIHLYTELRFSYPEDQECRALAIPVRVNFQKLLATGVNHNTLRKSNNYQVDKFISFRNFDSKVSILSSMQRPRRLYITGTDGRRYSILCKPHDDLRKDAKLMEFTTVMDRLLKLDSEADKRNLTINNYAVVPLNETMGLIEWVDNVKTMRDIMLSYLQRQGIVMDFGKIKQLLNEELSVTEKIHNFQKLTKMYQPVLQVWFQDQFPNPVNWYQCRNDYTKTCAVMSIVGYLVGMGDRHGDNIMLSELSGQILHVDFDCLFDKGKKLAVPERVPFRLTQNMTAAMGVTGYEGTFRKTCEVTMKIIRQNENSLMNVLETFLYDPIMDWKVKQKKRRSTEEADSKGLQPQVAMDTIRRKIKGILDPKDLDTGAKDSGGLPVSVVAHVDAVIQQATAVENLAQMIEVGLLLVLLAVSIRVAATGQEGPAPVHKELVWISLDGLHDGGPVQIHRTFTVRNIHVCQPCLHVFQQFHRNGGYVHNRLAKVLEHKHKIEVLETKLDSFQVRDLDLLQSDHQEWQINQLHQTVSRWKTNHSRPRRNTLEPKLSEWNIKIHKPVRSICNLLAKTLELLVKSSFSSSLLLFLLQLVLIAIPVLSLSVSGLVNGDIRSLSEKLNIVGLLLTNHDWRLQVAVNDHNQLSLTRLKEQMLDVGKQNVHSLVASTQRLVSDTILVNSNASRKSLGFWGWSHKNIIHSLWTVHFHQRSLCDNICLFSLLCLSLDGLLFHLGDLLQHLGHSFSVLRTERQTSDELLVVTKLVRKFLLLGHGDTWRVEVQLQVGVFSFITLQPVLESVDVEWNRSSTNRKDNGLVLGINVYLEISHIARDLRLANIRLVSLENGTLVRTVLRVLRVESVETFLLSFGMEFLLNFLLDLSLVFVGCLLLRSHLGLENTGIDSSVAHLQVGLVRLLSLHLDIVQLFLDLSSFVIVEVERNVLSHLWRICQHNQVSTSDTDGVCQHQGTQRGQDHGTTKIVIGRLNRELEFVLTVTLNDRLVTPVEVIEIEIRAELLHSFFGFHALEELAVIDLVLYLIHQLGVGNSQLLIDDFAHFVGETPVAQSTRSNSDLDASQTAFHSSMNLPAYLSLDKIPSFLPLSFSSWMNCSNSFLLCSVSLVLARIERLVFELLRGSKYLALPTEVRTITFLLVM